MADVFNKTPESFVDQNEQFIVVNDKIGLTSAQLKTLIENTFYLYNNLGLASIEVASVDTQFPSPGSFAEAEVTHTTIYHEGVPTEGLNFTFKIPTPLIEATLSTTLIDETQTPGMNLVTQPITTTIDGQTVTTGYRYSFTARLPRTPANYIVYDHAQSLTAEQQAQARSNIGVTSPDLSNYYTKSDLEGRIVPIGNSSQKFGVNTSNPETYLQLNQNASSLNRIKLSSNYGLFQNNSGDKGVGLNLNALYAGHAAQPEAGGYGKSQLWFSIPNVSQATEANPYGMYFSQLNDTYAKGRAFLNDVAIRLTGNVLLALLSTTTYRLYTGQAVICTEDSTDTDTTYKAGHIYKIGGTSGAYTATDITPSGGSTYTATAPIDITNDVISATFDTTPTASSTNFVNSGAVKSYVDSAISSAITTALNTAV